MSEVNKNKMDEELKKHVVKTGTTTLGIVCRDGIVIAADKRGTYGSDHGVTYIAGKDQQKIYELTPEIIVTTAGTASDTVRIIKVARAELKLKELRSKSKPTVDNAANLFSNIAYHGIRTPSMIPSIAHFLMAGYDDNGVYLYDIMPDGLLEKINNYAVSGSGKISVNPILDSEYDKKISVDEGIKLAKKCITASMGRDPATGDGIDIYVVKKGEVKQVAAQIIVSEYKDRN